MVKVIKFGGTSVSGVKAFNTVKAIRDKDKSEKCVVVSAPGKRFAEDIKVTDLLFLLCAYRQYTGKYKKIFYQVKERFDVIVRGLNLDFDLDGEFRTIEEDIDNGCDDNYIVSRGEYLCGKIMAAYLGYSFVDSRDVLVFDKSENLLYKVAKDRLANISGGTNIVIPGFYGSYENGKIKLFERDGSNITGGYMAKLMNADTYEIRTDVSGIMMANPNFVENPKLIRHVTYNELFDLNYLGAKVISPSAVWMLEDTKTNVKVLNTFRQSSGTLIDNNADKKYKGVVAIGGKQGFSSIEVAMNNKDYIQQTVKKIIEVHEDNGLKIEHLQTGNRSITVVVNKFVLEEVEDELITKIMDLGGVRSVSVDRDISMLSVVGTEFLSGTKSLQRIFTAISRADIKVKIIYKNSANSSVIMAINTQDLPMAVRGLYNELVDKNIR